ncbi:MAG: hypothetical protein RJB04_414, partial [Verrucomicrobiota bacterium]
MPELPEVEAFGRWLLPQVRGRCVTALEVLKPRLVRPLSPAQFRKALEGCQIQDIRRQGKCLLWELGRPSGETEL